MKGKVLRIGHMGYILPEQMVDLMMKLGQTLNQADSSFCKHEQMQSLEREMKKFWGLS